MPDKSKEFIEAFGKLREEYKLDFISVPQFVPTDHGTWELRIVPQIVPTDQPVPSPFVAE